MELLHNLGGGVFAALVVLYMSRGLGFNPGVLTTIWAVGGIASFAGAALAPRLSRRLGAGLVMALGLGVAGISALFIPLASGATLLSGVFLAIAQLGDGFFTVYQINVVSLWQSITEERLLGRVNATMKFIALAATLAGSLLGGVLGQEAGQCGSPGAVAYAAGGGSVGPARLGDLCHAKPVSDSGCCSFAPTSPQAVQADCSSAPGRLQYERIRG